MITFDRIDFIHNLAENLANTLEVAIDVVSLKKNVNQSDLYFVYQGCEFTLTISECEDGLVSGALFYGCGIDLSSTHLPFSFQEQQYSRQTFIAFSGCAVDVVKFIINRRNSTDTVH